MPPRKFNSIREYNKKFANKYDMEALSNQTYINTRVKLIHKCLICGFTRPVLPENIPLVKCPNCLKKEVGHPVNVSYTYEDMIEKLKEYDIEYISGFSEPFTTGSQITVKCSCGIVYDTSLFIIRTRKYKGCPNCIKQLDDKLHLSNKTIQKQLDQKFGKNMIKIVEKYKNNHTSCSFICKKGHKFVRTFGHLINTNYGCPICYAKKTKCQTSQIAIDIIQEIERKSRLQFMYLPKTDEYKVPNTRFKLDGYNKRFNIGIEFHGSYYHGEDDKTSDRYISTIKRDNIIKRKVHLIVVWEGEYKSNPKQTIKRCLKKIQKFKSLKQ